MSCSGLEDSLSRPAKLLQPVRTGNGARGGKRKAASGAGPSGSGDKGGQRTYKKSGIYSRDPAKRAIALAQLGSSSGGALPSVAGELA